MLGILRLPIEPFRRYVIVLVLCRSRGSLGEFTEQSNAKVANLLEGGHLKGQGVAQSSLQESAHAMNSIKDVTPPFLIPLQELGT